MTKLITLLLAVNLLTLEASAAWEPDKKNRDPQTGASKKTMIALEKFREIPELEAYFEEADGYAVFANIAKGGIGIGGAGGKGEVFQNGKAIGATSLKQFSIGFQLGGQAFSEIIFFKGKRDTNRFTEGNFEFGAQASAVLIKQGVAVETAYSNGVAVFTIAKGGLMYEASIAGQKFSFEDYD
jgi:lipid-binding SYLF domain-containing protein